MPAARQNKGNRNEHDQCRAQPEPGAAPDAYSFSEHYTKTEHRIPMRDGGWVAADVYRPRGHGRHPVLLVASGYPKKLDYLPSNPAYRFRETSDFEWWVGQGYAIVRTDARGTGESSDGQWDFFGPGEQRDLYDSIEWAAAQGWSNGRVGMLGQSYFAQVQWLAAVNRPPALACIAPYDGLVDIYRDLAWHGGLFSQEFVANWAARQVHLNQLPFEPAPPPNVMDFDVTGTLQSGPQVIDTDTLTLTVARSVFDLDSDVTGALGALSLSGTEADARLQALAYLQAAFAASDPGVTAGGYYGPTGFGQMGGPPGPVKPSRTAADASIAARLWEVSERLTGVRYEALTRRGS